MTAAGLLLLGLSQAPATQLATVPAADPLAVCDTQVAERPAAAASYRCYVSQARKAGARWDQAAQRLERLLAARPRNDWAQLMLAHVEISRGGDRAEERYRSAAAGFQAAGQSDGEVEALVGLAAVLARRGRLSDADEPLARATAVAEASGDRFVVARARVEQARQLWRKGEDLARAYRLAREAEDRAFPDGPPMLRILCLHVLAAVSSDLGRFDDSAALHRRELEIVLGEGDRFAEATTRGNLAVAVLNQLEADGREPTDEARQLMRDALEAAVASGNRRMEPGLRRDLGDLLEGPAALEQYQRGLVLARELGEAKGMGRCLRGMARVLAETDPPRAFRLVDEAMSLARRNGDRWDLVQAWHVRAHLRWEAGPRPAAIADSLAQLDAAEAIRDFQPDGEARAGLLARTSFAYYRLAGRLLRSSGEPPRASDLELAFAVTERMRSRVLLEALDAAGATAGIVPGTAVTRRNAVLEAITRTQQQLTNGSLPEATRRALLQELDEREREEQASREELARTHPGFAALRPRTPALREVQSALAGDQAILAFQVAERRRGEVDEGGSWLWVLTRDAVRVWPLPERSRITGAVALFLGLIARRDGEERQAAARLYADLLGPGLAEVSPGVTRLVVVPDGPLHHLPFAALRPAVDGEPMGVRYDITVAPSITLWMRLRQTAAPWPPVPALALADPETPLGPSSAAGGAPARDRAWGLALHTRLGPLPHARREARFAVEQLGGGSELLLGSSASERMVKSGELGRFRLVHFATHALVDEQKPERSAILLAPGGAAEDGLLQIREIVGLDLGGRVIVLSACRTASGAVLDGEGVMGLARAMFQARAQTVVGSLWPLRDDEAERIFAGFYRSLAQGRNVGDALRTARRERIRSGDPAAAWAALIVLGDADAGVLSATGATRRRSRWRWAPWALASVLVAGLAVWASLRGSRPARR